MIRIPLVFVLLCCILSSPLSTQVVARQGEPSVAENQEFKSPMILEASLKDFGELPMETGRDFKEFSRFYCDDLVLSRLLVAKKPRRGGGVVLAITGSVSVRPSHDRLASIHFDFLNADRVVASTRIAGINAEEGRNRVFTTKISLDEAQYKTLLDPPSSAQLRVKVTVVDND